MEKTYEPGDVVWYYGDGLGDDLRTVAVVGPQDDDIPSRTLILDDFEIGLDATLDELIPQNAGAVWLRGKSLRHAKQDEFDLPELELLAGTVVRHRTDSLRRLGVVGKEPSKAIAGKPCVVVYWAHKGGLLRGVDVRDLR